jgi:hypothetical protein
MLQIQIGFMQLESTLGDSKWLWINMATMYKNLCRNFAGWINLT